MNELFEYEIVDVQAIIKKYLGGDSLTEVVIPDEFENFPVTEIGCEAFADYRYDLYCFDLEAAFNCNEKPPKEVYSVIAHITIPKTVRVIGEGAFLGLANLYDIKLPDSLEVISDFAFAYCRNFHKVYIPDKVRKIGDNAFRSPNFRHIYIPPSAVEISKDAFEYSCSDYTELSTKIILHISSNAPLNQTKELRWGWDNRELFEILYDYDEYNGR